MDGEMPLRRRAEGPLSPENDALHILVQIDVRSLHIRTATVRDAQAGRDSCCRNLSSCFNR